MSQHASLAHVPLAELMLRCVSAAEVCHCCCCCAATALPADGLTLTAEAREGAGSSNERMSSLTMDTMLQSSELV
jgi:hypothetical protein